MVQATWVDSLSIPTKIDHARENQARPPGIILDLRLATKNLILAPDPSCRAGWPLGHEQAKYSEHYQYGSSAPNRVSIKEVILSGDGAIWDITQIITAVAVRHANRRLRLKILNKNKE